MTAVPTETGIATMAIADAISEQIRILAPTKNTQQIAREVGYLGAGAIEMFANGETKVPLDKSLKLAEALELDPAMFFRLALRQFWPDADRIFTKLFPRTVTDNEFKFISLVRGVTGSADPQLTAEQEESLRALFRTD